MLFIIIFFHLLLSFHLKSGCAGAGTSKPPPPPDEVDDLDLNNVFRGEVFIGKNRSLLPDETCGISTSHNDTTTKMHPWIITIQDVRSVKGVSRNVCSGILISAKYAIVPAHSLERHENSENKARYVALLGQKDLQQVVVQSVMYHPDFDFDPELSSENKTVLYTGDLALLRFVEKVDFSDEVKPICVPQMMNSDYEICEDCEGDEEEAEEGEDKENKNADFIAVAGSFAPDADREANLTEVRRSECSTIIQGVLGVTPEKNQICAGDGTFDETKKCGLKSFLLQYENQRYVFKGLNSMNIDDCGHTSLPYVYTALPHYIDWILDNIYD